MLWCNRGPNDINTFYLCFLFQEVKTFSLGSIANPRCLMSSRIIYSEAFTGDNSVLSSSQVVSRMVCKPLPFLLCKVNVVSFYSQLPSSWPLSTCSWPGRFDLWRSLNNAQSILLHKSCLKFLGLSIIVSLVNPLTLAPFVWSRMW